MEVKVSWNGPSGMSFRAQTGSGQGIFDLALGFDHEAQAARVAQVGRHGAHYIGARIPQRIEERGLRAQFLQPLGGPGQVVFFLARGLRELRAHRVALGKARLRLVQRLGAHLADVVHPHQAGAVALFGGVHLAVFGARGRGRARRRGHAADHAHGLVESNDQLVQGIDRAVR